MNMRIQGFTGIYFMVAAIAWGRLYGGRLYVNYHEVYATQLNLHELNTMHLH